MRVRDPARRHHQICRAGAVDGTPVRADRSYQGRRLATTSPCCAAATSCARRVPVLAAVLEACGALNEAIKTRALLLPIKPSRRLCSRRVRDRRADASVRPRRARGRSRGAPARSRTRARVWRPRLDVRARLVQARRARPPVLPIEHGQVFYPRIALARASLPWCPGSRRRRAPPGASLVAPLRGARWARTRTAALDVLRGASFFDTRESDDPAAFAPVRRGDQTRRARRGQVPSRCGARRPRQREFDDQLVAEALDWLSSSPPRARRARRGAAASEKNAAALSQAPRASSFAEEAAAARTAWARGRTPRARALV